LGDEEPEERVKRRSRAGSVSFGRESKREKRFSRKRAKKSGKKRVIELLQHFPKSLYPLWG